MAVTATGSTYSRNNALIIGVVCLGVALIFFNDGWLSWFGRTYREEQLAKNDGKPTINLLFNQYAPFPLALVAVYMFFRAVQIPKLRAVADENGLTVNNETPIAYSDITHIDNRFFKEKGYFVVGYRAGGEAKEVRLSDRLYDKLALLLDELVARTGAKPESEVKSDSDSSNREEDRPTA